MDARIKPLGSQGVLIGSAFGAQKEISLQVYNVCLLLRTQPTQHRIYTKAPKLRSSGEKNAIVLKFIRFFASGDAADAGPTLGSNTNNIQLQ